MCGINTIEFKKFYMCSITFTSVLCGKYLSPVRELMKEYIYTLVNKFCNVWNTLLKTEQVLLPASRPREGDVNGSEQCTLYIN